MSYSYSYPNDIDLFVKDRISREDAQRQEITSREILKRLETQPGLILADEVGMGKTFVALAVAASIALGERQRRPVVVMVPPSLKKKWPKDFKLFSEKCLTPHAQKTITSRSVEHAVDFLKLLDDDPSERTSIIFLTHGAMNPNRKLNDHWVKFAIIRQALYRRHGIENLKRAISRCASDLLRAKWTAPYGTQVWMDLLNNDPYGWLEILQNHDLEPPDKDDPVPEAAIEAMKEIDFNDLFRTLQEHIPRKMSVHYDYHLKQARKAVNDQIAQLWEICIRTLPIRLPLLVFDEAHHLKNPGTQLASLFHVKEAEDDAEEFSSGPLAGVFERMLFLTATPFQLGHFELCNVLDRFKGINWKYSRAPEMKEKGYEDILADIRQSLDSAQEAAVRLDCIWGNLKHADLISGDETFTSTEDWWPCALDSTNLTTPAEQVIQRFNQARIKMREAEEQIKPWLIRHSRPRELSTESGPVKRRLRYSGRNILHNQIEEEAAGLNVDGQALLPFLLAARVTSMKPDSRPVFAEGLASSYEAFMHTRRQRMERIEEKQESSLTDCDDEEIKPMDTDTVSDWYLDRLEGILNEDSMQTVKTHPKVDATVMKTIELWKEGEKVLIFCHYLATGAVLRNKIREAMKKEINRMAAKKLKSSMSNAEAELARVGKRFFDTDSPIRRGFDKAIGSILNDFPLLDEYRDRIIDITRSYIRTDSFLARFFPLGGDTLSEEMAFKALNRKDSSGMTLELLLRDFFDFMVSHCGEDERDQYLKALDKVRGASNVRLANGRTSSEIRQRLMLTFNTPFYPEVLVASMIMAEGVDLHLNCRYVIHHDLCWNPSTLEQRTGRIDRIGAKVEKCRKSISVYLPYVSETQDEKMYRVVMDRERWFKVVMGEKYKVDARTADKMAERLPFPEKAASELAFNLGLS